MQFDIWPHNGLADKFWISAVTLRVHRDLQVPSAVEEFGNVLSVAFILCCLVRFEERNWSLVRLQTRNVYDNDYP